MTAWDHIARDGIVGRCPSPRVARTSAEEGHATATGLARLGLPVRVLPLARGRRRYDWKADPLPVEDWTPDRALVLVTGHGLDVLELDAADPSGLTPGEARRALVQDGVLILGETRTPSGGAHFYVLSAGIPSLLCSPTPWRFHAGQGTRRASAVYLPGTRRPEYGGLGYTWTARPVLADLPGVFTDVDLWAAQADTLRSLVAALRPVSCGCAA